MISENRCIPSPMIRHSLLDDSFLRDKFGDSWSLDRIRLSLKEVYTNHEKQTIFQTGFLSDMQVIRNAYIYYIYIYIIYIR